MRSFAIVIMFVMIGCRCYGQNSAEYQSCVDKSHAQSELNKCASGEAARADSELNAAYNGFLAKIAGDSLAIAKLREAERAWLRYRDAYIEAVYPAQDKQLAYGTEYPMDVNLLRAKLTHEHLAAIAYLINEYQPTQ
jgi:uncharacterized protein YecT (DUF1311 family)